MLEVHEVRCAWCRVLIREGVAPVSHGICELCQQRLKAEIKTARADGLVHVITPISRN